MRALAPVFSRDYWRGVLLLSQVSLTGNYRGTFLGDLWMVLQPIFYITCISLAFSLILQVQVKDYALYLVSGLLPWQMLVGCFSGCANSLTARDSILKHTYISKTMFIFADVLVQFYTFIISFVSILTVVTVFVSQTVHPTLLLLPVAVLPLFITCACGAVAMAYIGPYIRDIGHLLGVLFNALFWTVPLVYMIDRIPPEYLIYFQINPLFMLIHPIHLTVYYGVAPSLLEWASAFGVAAVMMIIAIVAHHKLKRNVIYYL